MNIQELKTELNSLGLPVAYREFKNTSENPVPSPPFITYHFTFNSDLIADNQNYVDIENFQVELYTAKKDLAAEKAIQDKLKELGLPYQKFETFIDSEKLYQMVYEIQILGG